ncbi:MAG TPA: NUDIX hydrolase [Polyangiaceae bacterium]|jgi:8-oxo-dGTP pyrophosphatase MutT (NUDIX family)
MPAHPTTLDRGIQLGFIVAHRMLRAYWAVRRPETHGSLVAVWHAGELLIVKNSYRREHTLPGGYRRPGETAEEAGARELAEECAIYIDPTRIREVYRGTHPFEFRKDDVTIVETEIETRPSLIGIDYREVTWAGFKPPAEILGMRIVPHLREYIEQRAKRA